MDVEGDNEMYEEYEWAGQRRIRATTLLVGGFAGECWNVTGQDPCWSVRLYSLRALTGTVKGCLLVLTVIQLLKTFISLKKDNTFCVSY